jgi:hypothetical protein
MSDVIQRERCIALACCSLPFIPRLELQIGGLAKPARGGRSVITERNRFAGGNVKRFADARSIFQRELECSRNVFCVDMLESCKSIIRQLNRITALEAIEHCRIEISCRIDRHPSRARDVSRMEHRRRKTIACFVEQIFLDRCLLYSVIAERLAGSRLIVRA